jgi:DNA-nicking Smr family endonuclease
MIPPKIPGERFMEEIQMPIDGTLDLHAFLPQEAKSVVEEYLLACVEKGIYEIKIIHGKGKGVLAHTIQAFLKNHPNVIEFWTDTGPSGWGATIVRLKGNYAFSDPIK